MSRLILEQSQARAALLGGIDHMTALLRPTLGPTARTVAVARLSGSGTPEVLDNAATIVTRTLRFTDPFETMGGMLVRQLVQTVSEKVGDGGATSAVIAHRLVHEAARYIAAGGNAMLIRRGVERALPFALEELQRTARPVELPAELAGVVAGIVRDPGLSRMIGEIVDSVGADGAILIEDSQATVTTHNYIEGLRWNEGYVSHFLLRPGEIEARLIDARIFITDQELSDANQLVPAVEACLQSGGRSLMVIAPAIRDAALALLILNREKGVLKDAVAVKAPGLGAQRKRILEDIAVVTGGYALLRDQGRLTTDVSVADLGSARQVWVTRFAFGILGGHGSREAIRMRVREARAELQAASGDTYATNKIRERIGKLSGTAAIIRVGATTRSTQAELKVRIEAAIASARSALEHGVVAGGGAAYLGCVSRVKSLELAGDERMGAEILSRALAEPMIAILENAGIDPALIIHDGMHSHAGESFDVLRRSWVDPWAAGILDPLPVATTALETAVSTAMMAMTTDVLIRNRKSSSHG